MKHCYVAFFIVWLKFVISAVFCLLQLFMNKILLTDIVLVTGDNIT